MSSSYPGALDSFTNPSGANDLDDVVGGRTHSQMHADINDGMEAVQGELGTHPSGSYATVKARLDAVQSRVFDAVVYGAVVDGSTDDTAAWQAAIDAAAAAGGGMVTSSKPGVSVIAGALQDTSGANAQLTLPQVDYGDGEAISITIRGPFPPAVVPSVIGTTPVPDNALVLKSTLGSGAGALLGAYGPSGTFANFTNVHLALEDIAFRLPSNPTNTAVDLRRVASVSGSFVVDTGSYDVDALTQPTTSTSYGVRLPANNNGAKVDVGRIDAIGFYTGVQHSEHLNAEHIVTWGCRVGLETNAGNHSSHIKRLMAVHCTTPWKATGGAAAVDVEQFAIEHANSSHGWRQTTYDIDDASNYLLGFVRWWSVLAGTGPHDSFTVNGATGITASRVGAAIGSGGGSTIYSYRDRLTAATNDSILTLGATPVANTPVVWKNGTLQWPTTDYTVAGNVLTFGSVLTSGDVVAVKYESLSSSASAATLTGSAVNIVDDFNRANSSTSLGTTSTGGKTWVQESGVWGIVSNQAYLASSATAVRKAHVEASVADCTVSTKIYQQSGGSRYYGLVLRSNGAGNCYLVQINGDANQIDVQKQTGGSSTTLLTAVSYTPAAGDVISAVLSGSSITIKVNGSTVLAGSDSTYNSNTKHGIWCYETDRARFDDFSIQP
jgi:hypothetical protein